jgi:polysaccharide deacetylase 2 family uncharacterized protein YibQ
VKLPSIRLPFLKRRSGAAEDDRAEPSEIDLPDAPEGPTGKARLLRFVVPVVTGILSVLVIGGTGGILGWLLVNAETTEVRRMLERPQITVAILQDGELPVANSSMPAGRTAEAANGSPPAAEAGAVETGGVEAAPTAEPDPVPTDGVRLAAVDPVLLEIKGDSRLPKVSEDGRRPWSTYARPFNLDDTRPRVAVVVTGLGLSRTATEQAIATLPGAISLSFSPYTRDLESWITRARRAGHETLIDLPMEPLDFPRDDPGPLTLLTSLSLVDNLNRLEAALGLAPGYVGITTRLGAQFTTVEDALLPVLEELRDRGLFFLDTRQTSRSIASELASSIQLPRAFNNVFVDAQPASDAIDRALASLEAIARQQRFAVGIAQPMPVTLDRLARWAGTLDGKGIALAPVTAIADRQRLR